MKKTKMKMLMMVGFMIFTLAPFVKYATARPPPPPPTEPLAIITLDETSSMYLSETFTFRWLITSGYGPAGYDIYVDGDIVQHGAWNSYLIISFEFDPDEYELTTEDREIEIVARDLVSDKTIDYVVTIDEAEWTVMFYLDGDIDEIVYQGAIFKDQILADQGSCDQVNLVSLLDLSAENSRYQYYRSDNSIYSNNDIGEKNMGDGTTLEDFIDWSQTYFPAENYLLILFDHGMGIMNEIYPHEIGGVCYDGDDYLTPQEIKNALSGKNIDILGMDACLMGSTEIHYAVRNEIQYYVASEETENAGIWSTYDTARDSNIIIDDDGMSRGWPYELIVPWLKINPMENIEIVANKIVLLYYESWNMPFYIDFDKILWNDEDHTYYTEHYINFESIYNGTLSNVKSSYMLDIQLQFTNLCGEMITLWPNNYEKFSQVRARCQSYYLPFYIDLYDLLNELLIEFSGSSTLINYIQTLQSTLNNAVKEQVYFQDDWAFSHGMSLYFPTVGKYWTNYANTEWSIDTNWDSFLELFC